MSLKKIMSKKKITNRGTKVFGSSRTGYAIGRPPRWLCRLPIISIGLVHLSLKQ